jgi:UDP-galactopyranose mutase
VVNIIHPSVKTTSVVKYQRFVETAISMPNSAVIIGAGFAGSTIARLLVDDGWEVTVLEKDLHAGGGCRTLFYGGHPYTNGPRLYYGYSEKVYNWISKYLEMRKVPFELRTYIESENRFYTYPIHEDDLPYFKDSAAINKELASISDSTDIGNAPKNFEDYWIARVGPTLYDLFVNQYSKKMWRIESNADLDTFAWSAKDKPLQSGSRRAYKGSYLAYPYGLYGYNPYFDKCLLGSKTIYGVGFQSLSDDSRSVIGTDGKTYNADVIISTISIDDLFQADDGPLPYVGRTFIPFVLPCSSVIPGDVLFLHYSQREPYTRIVEYKKLTLHEDPNTLLVMEFPASAEEGGRLYPYMRKKDLAHAEKYRKRLPGNIYSIGRLGTYRYSTIEQTISQAFQCFKHITNKSIDGIENEFYQIGDVDIVKDRTNIDSNK